MVNEDNDIVLSKKGSFIKNVQSGRVIKLDLEKGTPQFDVWVKKARELAAFQSVSVNGLFKQTQVSNKFEELNAHGEADIKDSEVSSFQRLEMHI